MSGSANSNIRVLGGVQAEVSRHRVCESLRMGAGYRSLVQPITHHNKATPKARVLGSITPKRAGAQHYGNYLEKMEERR